MATATAAAIFDQREIAAIRNLLHDNRPLSAATWQREELEYWLVLRRRRRQRQMRSKKFAKRVVRLRKACARVSARFALSDTNCRCIAAAAAVATARTKFQPHSRANERNARRRRDGSIVRTLAAPAADAAVAVAAVVAVAAAARSISDGAERGARAHLRVLICSLLREALAHRTHTHNFFCSRRHFLRFEMPPFLQVSARSLTVVSVCDGGGGGSGGGGRGSRRRRVGSRRRNGDGQIAGRVGERTMQIAAATAHWSFGGDASNEERPASGVTRFYSLAYQQRR